MFIILYYDVNAKRCNKMLRICRKYIQWVQNSVFEGEIGEANYEKMILELKGKMKEEDGDSIVVYKFRTMQYVKRETFGTDKKEDINFI